MVISDPARVKLYLAGLLMQEYHLTLAFLVN